MDLPGQNTARGARFLLGRSCTWLWPKWIRYIPDFGHNPNRSPRTFCRYYFCSCSKMFVIIIKPIKPSWWIINSFQNLPFIIVFQDVDQVLCIDMLLYHFSSVEVPIAAAVNTAALRAQHLKSPRKKRAYWIALACHVFFFFPSNQPKSLEHRIH